jgi:hypothetical protein
LFCMKPMVVGTAIVSCRAYATCMKRLRNATKVRNKSLIEQADAYLALGHVVSDLGHYSVRSPGTWELPVAVFEEELW